MHKEGITVVFGKGKTIEKTLCSLKPKITMQDSKNNVYLKRCTKCNFKYIGESGIRTGKTRCGLYKHVRDFKDRDIDWENQIILDKDPDIFRRRIKEAVYIKANDDGYLMNPDKGCPINECWNEFNTLVKKNMRKH